MTVAPEDEELTIKTGGRILGGWTRYRATRGVERLPSDFIIELTERYPGQAQDTVATVGDKCEVFLGADKIITGWVERYSPSIGANDHKVTISGRSLCNDVVDCSVKPPLWSLNVTTLGQAAKILCDPFGLAVSMPDGDAELTQVKAFPVQPGYTVYALLEEVARCVAMLIWDNADGALVLSKVGDAKSNTSLVLGEKGNVKRAAPMITADQRYSDYIVMAQNSQPVTAADPTGKANIIGTFKDPDITRYRPLVIQIEYDAPDHSIAIQRAKWEAARRYGRALQMQVVVTGWRDGDGKLWAPNTRVIVDMPALKVSQQELVISEVSWQRGEDGTEAVLTLMRPEGLMPEPIFLQPPIQNANAGAANDAGRNTTGSSITPGAQAPPSTPRQAPDTPYANI